MTEFTESSVLVLLFPWSAADVAALWSNKIPCVGSGVVYKILRANILHLSLGKKSINFVKINRV